MNTTADIVILNNCPAFYKINLYNKIAEHKSIFVIFLGYYSEVIIDENFKNSIQFPYVMLNEVPLDQRNIFKSFMMLKDLLDTIKFKKIIYGGYTYPEFILTSFLISENKNVLQTESAGETKLTGIRFYVKKILLKRYSTAIVSGTIHKRMLQKMQFKKNIIISKGVGIINHLQTSHDHVKPVGPLKFLFVGRLIELKNIERLIRVFNENGFPLTIIGKGALELDLKAIANPNITFIGFVNNLDLIAYYKEHHILVLPSLSEAWGLVVEEALMYGCVLALSNRVGCAEDLLFNPEKGVTFDPVNRTSFQKGIEKVKINYAFYKDNVDKFDFNQKMKDQISAYTSKLLG